MKLNEKEIDNIIDDILQEDDVWAEFDAEWVEEYLNDYTKYEYDNEDLNEISKRVQDARKEIQEEYNTEWVEDYLNDENVEYDDEDVNKILEGLIESQKEFQQQALSEEKETLYQELDQYIEDADIHLDLTNIGKVLVKLANSYLDE